MHSQTVTHRVTPVAAEAYNCLKLIDPRLGGDQGNKVFHFFTISSALSLPLLGLDWKKPKSR
jgi:hypothetical protein